MPVSRAIQRLGKLSRAAFAASFMEQLELQLNSDEYQLHSSSALPDNPCLHLLALSPNIIPCTAPSCMNRHLSTPVDNACTMSLTRTLRQLPFALICAIRPPLYRYCMHELARPFRLPRFQPKVMTPDTAFSTINRVLPVLPSCSRPPL